MVKFAFLCALVLARRLLVRCAGVMAAVPSGATHSHVYKTSLKLCLVILVAGYSLMQKHVFIYYCVLPWPRYFILIRLTEAFNPRPYQVRCNRFDGSDAPWLGRQTAIMPRACLCS